MVLFSLSLFAYSLEGCPFAGENTIGSFVNDLIGSFLTELVNGCRISRFNTIFKAIHLKEFQFEIYSS
ncbi:MAG: hypothetical protein GF311_01705 [Candidatus Lokiarchaeota archaeon]|nr:hypothetical protein [Candidatus Lokiarchaeota archaeon]